MENIYSIICIPHGIDTYIYYINNGERHLCNKEKMKKIVKESCPDINNQIYYFFDRNMSFLLNVQDKSIKEIIPTVDENSIREKILKSPDFSSYKKDSNTESIKSQDTIAGLLEKISHSKIFNY